MDATAKPDLRGFAAEQIAAEIAVKVPESQQVNSVADAQPDDGDMWAAVELPAQCPSAVMWASTDDILGAHWDNLGAAHGAGGQSVAEGRESELSGVSDALSVGGLRFDMHKWEKGMHDLVSNIGVRDAEPVVAPLAERMADSENRLRILEEDRDELRQQAGRLQRMLDTERADRQRAQQAQQAAVGRLRELNAKEESAHSGDANKIQELEATASMLRQKLERARRHMQVPAADVVESLRQRTRTVEGAELVKDAQHLQWQRDMGKKLALTLKVLQLQKEHADKVEMVQDKLHRYVSEAAVESTHTRTNLARQRELVAALLRRQEMLYAEEGERQRALSHMKSQVEMVLTLGKQKARRLREYESGLEEDLKNSEYERRLHQQLQTEYVLESQAEAGGLFSLAGAINDHRRNMAS